MILRRLGQSVLTRPLANVGVRHALVRVGVHLLPARRHAVVTGFPDDEGNSVEVVRLLAGRLPVYWLVGDDPPSLTWLLSETEAEASVQCLKKGSWRALWKYMTARYVFFTHGLYGSPSPPRRKTFVNLWHGDGPKRRKGFAVVRSTFVVSGTRLWAEQKVQSFGVGSDRVLLTGLPRIDQFARPASDDQLRALGIAADKPLVLWLPTYRETNYRGVRLRRMRHWVDADNLSTSPGVHDLIQPIAQDAEACGIALAVKPHPLDSDEFHGSGMNVLTTRALRTAQVTLYQLLGRAHGLITDYSSVWTDFMVLDRPIGFFCPDLERYVAGRGLNVEDYPSLIPGPLLKTRDDFREFLGNCLDEPPASRLRRSRSAELIGAGTSLGATERLLDALNIAPREYPASSIVSGQVPVRRL